MFTLQWELKEWNTVVNVLCSFLFKHKSDKVKGEVNLLDNFLYELCPDSGFIQGDT